MIMIKKVSKKSSTIALIGNFQFFKTYLPYAEVYSFRYFIIALILNGNFGHFLGLVIPIITWERPVKKRGAKSCLLAPLNGNFNINYPLILYLEFFPSNSRKS